MPKIDPIVIGFAALISVLATAGTYQFLPGGKSPVALGFVAVVALIGGIVVPEILAGIGQSKETENKNEPAPAKLDTKKYYHIITREVR